MSLAPLRRRFTSLRRRARRRRYLGVLAPWARPFVRRAGLDEMIERTHNFEQVTWLGRPVWQNICDAWTLQEAVVEGDIDLVIECGTHRGGSAFFLATIFDMLGRGHVVSIDVRDLVDFTHPRITFLKGSSVDPDVVREVERIIDERGAEQPLVLLDSDHSAPHVAKELAAYAPLVPVGGYMLVQDGSIDELPRFRGRPGPLRAIEAFVAANADFVVDRDRSDRYVFSHSPDGWLRRVGTSSRRP